jgi:hypothetical protein
MRHSLGGGLANTDSTHTGLQRPQLLMGGIEAMTSMKAITTYNSIRENLFSHPFVEIRDLFSCCAARKLPTLRNVGKRSVWVENRLLRKEILSCSSHPIGAKIGFSTSLRPVSGLSASCETVSLRGIPPTLVSEDSRPPPSRALSGASVHCFRPDFADR